MFLRYLPVERAPQRLSGDAALETDLEIHSFPADILIYVQVFFGYLIHS